MSRFTYALALLLAALSFSSPVLAFSTESSTNTFKGSNASNFADPDEQQPAFVTGGAQPSSLTNTWQPSNSPDPTADRERQMGLSQGFDQAYSRK
jgi:hypothetical protein